MSPHRTHNTLAGTSTTLPGPSAFAPRRAKTFLLIAVALTIGFTGCRKDRTYYRQQADSDAYCLIDHKSAPVGADPAEYRIEIDPRSRMFDPHSPDCEPMPPDDPLSHNYMECVDCKKGSKCWKCLPQTPFVDNPNWQEQLPRNIDGDVQLNLQDAVTMALIHSPNYQSELEDLYLSALDVSFERFRFDAQFFGGSSVFYEADGRDHAASGAPSRGLYSSSSLDVGTSRSGNRYRLQRLTATGGELVVGVANSLMWQFAGDNDYGSNTVLD
ncbi:MAG: hypothetical protein KDA61_01675, partial [Planctomycetales bacterium]|nr:hypothetical protein [Planctomycetales bacterium]